jgi:hypothetical protein
MRPLIDGVGRLDLLDVEVGTGVELGRVARIDIEQGTNAAVGDARIEADRAGQRAGRAVRQAAARKLEQRRRQRTAIGADEVVGIFGVGEGRAQVDGDVGRRAGEDLDLDALADNAASRSSLEQLPLPMMLSVSAPLRLVAAAVDVLNEEVEPVEGVQLEVA